MFEILDNIYDISIAIVFGIAFFGTFRRLWKLAFQQKIFKILYLCLLFIHRTPKRILEKTSMTQEWLVVQS